MIMIEAMELETRCSAIRLHKQELARRSMRHPNTITNLFQGKGNNTDTLSAVSRVLLEEELRLRDHLLALHPITQEAAE